MLRQVKVERFRGFEKLALDLRPVTVLVGPNSSGKTSVLQALRLGLQLLDFAFLAETPLGRVERGGAAMIRVTEDTLVPDLSRFIPLLDWEALFPRSHTAENVALKIELLFDAEDEFQRIETSLRCGRNRQLKLSAWVSARKAQALVRGKSPRSSLVNATLRDYLRPHIPRAVFVPPFYGVVREEEYRAGPVVDRMLGGGDQSHIVRNLIMRLPPEALARLNAALVEEIGMRVSARTTESERESHHPLRVEFRGGNGALELSAAGAGLVNLLAVLATLERYRAEADGRSVLFLFDEPEAHLHPKLQGTVANRLATAIRSFGGQVLLATHSVEMINRLAQRDDASVVRVDRSAPAPAVLNTQHELVSELMSWADLTPFSLVNFLASRLIVFCEGPSDHKVLEQCAAVYLRNDPRRLERFRQWTIVELVGSGNRSIPDLLGQVLKAHLIPAATDGRPVRVITLLDRDATRTPGTKPEVRAGGALETEETVWSRHSIENLLLEVEVLAPWIRAFAGDALPKGVDLTGLIIQAIEVANRDVDLLNQAQIALTLPLANEASGGKKEMFAARSIAEAGARAAALVRHEPAVWQRGHDRSKAVLGAVRGALPPAVRSTFPVDVVSLLERTDPERFGLDVAAAIPREIRELLDRMVRASVTSD